MKIRFNTPENKAPDYDGGVQVQYGAAKRALKPWRWYIIVLVSSAPLLYLIGLVLYEFVAVKADGQISAPNITVRSVGNGYVAEMLVEPLQEVTVDTALAILKDATLEDDYQRVRREINFLIEEKNKLALQSDDVALSLKQLVAFARAQKHFYHNRLHQYESLFKQGAATQVEVATARSQYNSASENLVARERMDNRGLGLNKEIRQIAIRVNQLESDLDVIEHKRRQLRIVSPENGRITEVFVQPGEFLGKGQRILEMTMPEKVYIRAFIPPKYQDYAIVDAVVTVTLPNGESAKAKITSVPGITHKSLSEDISLLETPQSTILAHLKFIEPIKTQLVRGVPVDIRFHHWFR